MWSVRGVLARRRHRRRPGGARRGGRPGADRRRAEHAALERPAGPDAALARLLDRRAGVGAVHMTWGAVNEWTTQAGYAAAGGSGPATRRWPSCSGGSCARRAGTSTSTPPQAERRLQGDRRAQRLTRFALRRLWKPVGSDVMPATEVRFLVHHLFGSEGGATPPSASTAASTGCRASTACISSGGRRRAMPRRARDRRSAVGPHEAAEAEVAGRRVQGL